MKKSLIFILFIIFTIVLCSHVNAEVAGDCVNCHTMHSMQGGADMATYGNGSGANPCLTRGDCIGCHAYGAGSGTDNVENIDGSLVPQIFHDAATDLAAGNFKYISTDPDANDNKGHNVAAIDQEGTAAMFPPPGYETDPGITASNFSCAGVYGCHGDRTVTDETTSIKGAHHADDGTIDGNTTGTSYRFLKGVLGLENNGSNPWQNVSATDHNEYKGVNGPGASPAGPTSPANNTMSGLCAECHGYYHGTGAAETGGTASPWLRHPIDISLPSSGEYTNYTTYNVVAPVARVTIPGTPSGTVSPSGTDNDIVMCLSCHGAHATDYYKLMRWDYASATLLSGTPVLTDALYGCIICHTSKD